LFIKQSEERIDLEKPEGTSGKRYTVWYNIRVFVVKKKKSRFWEVGLNSP
jgi:hypothetical protein